MSIRSEVKEILEANRIPYSRKSNTKRLCSLLKRNQKINWKRLSEHRLLSEEFITEFHNQVYWLQISLVQRLSEDTIKRFNEQVHWTNISISQFLSEDTIRQFHNNVDWYWISREQQLSESLIREFNDKVHWKLISQYQQLSESFIRENRNKLNKGCLSRYQQVSDNLIREFGLYRPGNNWRYATKEEKLDYIKRSTQFEVIGNEYVIAYKEVDRNNGLSYSHQYMYLPGNCYRSNCDCNMREDVSFGLYAWTKERVMKYRGNHKILKVKINIEDIGAIVHNFNKIRCFKMEILEEISL